MRDSLEAILRTPSAGPWRRFSSPVRIVRAFVPGDVRDALSQVDDAVSSGLYAAGFVSYEAAGAFGLPVRPGPPDLPLVCFGLFTPGNVETLGRFPVAGEATVGTWTPSITHDTYLDAISTIKSRIEAGDTYQINYTFRLTAPFTGDPRALMRDLHARQAGRWSAFVDIGTHTLCSASPELFFSREGGAVSCLPMKGTAARGWWPDQDLARGAALRRSDKNRAENVMIVDMVRNDLGRAARTGSVQVVSLFDAERYPLQWQLTSRVIADVADAGLVTLFEAMFPSGSVTGAPKHSAMGLIAGLESAPRGVYTGAIGYLSPNGRSHFNVAIRTVVVDRARNVADFGVGSGIVWDSVDSDEYEECLIKAGMVIGLQGSGGVQGSHGFQSSTAQGLAGSLVPAYVTGEHPDFRLLETIGWTPEAGYSLLERHLNRLRASAECFGFPCDVADIQTLLTDAAAALHQPSKVRVLLDADGGLLCEALDLGRLPDRPLRAAVAVTPIDRFDLFLYHKTTRRDVYDRAGAECADAETVILWNTAGEVTEATDFNVVVELSGARVTPPLECGLLPGTMRAELLERGDVIEGRITIDELRVASRKWLVNSVRGWVEFEL
ncbi:MAG: chorismate-binding protein [Vicinamibacterales bacterium]